MQMDLWVVAAATSAGYLAKYWKDILGGEEGSSGFLSRSSFSDNPDSSSLSRQNADKILTSHKSPRVDLSEQYINEAGKGDCLDDMFAKTCRSDDPFIRDLGYTNVLDHEKQMERFEEYKKEYREDADMPDIPENQIWEMGDTHSSGRSSKCLRGGRLQRLSLPYVKPRSSLDSCLMAQMHREHAGMEEFLRTPLPSPCTPALRSFLNNERQVMNRASGDFRMDLYKEVCPKLYDEVVCVPRLPQIIKTKQNLNKCKMQTERSSNVKKPNRTDTSNGSSSDKVLFCLGISIGVMSNLIANKAEVEKLKDRLKESENLAQDLQEELEMKDSLTVKELVNDDDSQDIHESSNSCDKINLFSNQANSGVTIRYNDEESVSSEKIESLSKIEAELEAELERLELSMKGSSLQEGKSDAFEENGQDVSAELVQGELNADLFGGKSSSEVTPDRGSTPRYVNDGVSPHELSLRLHEVIQSRLQQRIMELEAELVKSQKRIERLESEKNTWRDLSRSESSSNMSSPVARPLKKNPSRDTIDAYNEINGELNKINGSQNAGSWIHDGNEEEDTRLSSDQGMKKKLNPNQNGGNRVLPNESSRNKDDDRDDDDDDDDDDDLLLIKHIVEKARQGSPAILKARKAMLCLNNDN